MGAPDPTVWVSRVWRHKRGNSALVLSLVEKPELSQSFILVVFPGAMPTISTIVGSTT
jgi:hypothetical protein